jgi:ribosomal-protein-alanine N-acetyltransferase
MPFSLVRCGVGGSPLEPIPVEIAYFTLPEFQGRTHATRTASALVAIALEALPGAVVIAFTLQEHNASTRILQRLGFKLFGNARDADARDVWEWRL